MIERDASADLLADAAVALAASTRTDDLDLAAVYLATATMKLVQVTERLEILGRGVVARERELIRISKLPKAAT